jgi:hypothetical protein
MLHVHPKDAKIGICFFAGAQAKKIINLPRKTNPHTRIPLDKFLATPLIPLAVKQLTVGNAT